MIKPSRALRPTKPPAELALALNNKPKPIVEQIRLLKQRIASLRLIQYR